MNGVRLPVVSMADPYTKLTTIYGCQSIRPAWGRGATYAGLLILLPLVLVLSACGEDPEPASAPVPTSTSTPAPTPPVPTSTSIPTPAPTVTSVPVSPTPLPTATSVPVPIAPPAPAAGEDVDVVERLLQGAGDFEYTIGRRGGALTFATISDPLTFNLAIAKDASSSGVVGPLFEGLTESSWLTNEVEPLLAESWEVSGDGLTWTFQLRQDVSWHDGQPFTAHDVDFTFNRIIYNDDIPASSRSTFEFRFLDEESGEWRVEPMIVTAVDDHTVQCVLPVSFAPFLRSMETSI